MPPHRCLPLLLLTAGLPAQDLIATGVGGGVFMVDSHGFTVTQLGPGRADLHGLTTIGASLWACETIDQNSARLVQIDPLTGAAFTVRTSRNYVALAWDDMASLYGVRSVQLSSLSRQAIVERIDAPTGQGTPVATWGATSSFPTASPTGLAVHQGVLYGWDTLTGLLRIDPGTGAVIPVGPGAVFVSVRFLLSHPDGRLLCGLPFGVATGLGQIDPGTGTISTLGTLRSSLLGCAAGNPRLLLGQGCADAVGPATLMLRGTCFAGSTAAAVSTNHALGTLGAMIFGWSTTSWAGQSLPLVLDPLLGTRGCMLFTSIDASMLGATPLQPPGELAFSFALPPAAAGLSFAIQHATLAPVPGFTSWSNGVALTVLR